MGPCGIRTGLLRNVQKQSCKDYKGDSVGAIWEAEAREGLGFGSWRGELKLLRDGRIGAGLSKHLDRAWGSKATGSHKHDFTAESNRLQIFGAMEQAPLFCLTACPRPR